MRNAMSARPNSIPFVMWNNPQHTTSSQMEIFHLKCLCLKDFR